MSGGARLFDAFRTIGVVCDSTPFAVHRNGSKRYLTAGVGRGFLVYDLDKLVVKMASPSGLGALAGNKDSKVPKGGVQALASHRESTFVACGGQVTEWVRGKLTRTLLAKAEMIKEHGLGSVVQLLVFGGSLLALYLGRQDDSRGAALVVVSLEKGRVSRVIPLGGEPQEPKQAPKSKGKSKAKGRKRSTVTNLTPFTPTCMMHPDTYLNKVLIGSAEGTMALLNMRTGQTIHSFKPFYTESPLLGGSDSSPTKEAPGISCVEQSPAVDVVAVGLTDGRIVLHNLRMDEKLFSFTHCSGMVKRGGSKLIGNLSITSLTFRTGGVVSAGTAPPFSMMVSSNAAGELAVWDLDEQRMASVIRDAHDGAVSRAVFLPNEPILVSSGSDNCIKMFIFDQEDGTARLLKSRQGHKSPPARIRYFGGDTISTLSSGADASCCQILSAGRDRSFRVFHSARDQLNREMSQGPLLKKARHLDVKVDQLKLPPIVDFATTEARQRDWCNVLSAHVGEGTCFTWSLENKTVGAKVLRPDGDVGKLSLRKLATDQITSGSAAAGGFPAALSVAISACGNFGVCGTESGLVLKYNMQSGLPRGSFPKPRAQGAQSLSKAERTERRKKRRKLDAASIKLLENIDADPFDVELNGTDAALLLTRGDPDKHKGAVRGVGVDSLNGTLFSAGHDGSIRFWDFETHELLKVLDLRSPIAQLVANRDAGLFAVALDDLGVAVVDVAARKVIRTFRGHTAPVLDMAFSNDARWLATCSADTSLRIWDLPTARCIEWVQFPIPVTGLSFSPTGEFLATSFADSVGITLWANKAFFGQARADTIALRPIMLEAPDAAIMDDDEQDGDQEDDDETAAGNSNDDDDEALQVEKVREADGAGQASFSGTEATKWYSLAHLELIKARNKPTEALEKPEKAPFFLTSTQGVNPVMVGPGKKAEDATTTHEEQKPDMGALEQAGEWSDDSEDDDDDHQDSTQEDAPTFESRLIRSKNESGPGGFARPRTKLLELLELAHAEYQAEHAVLASVKAQETKQKQRKSAKLLVSISDTERASKSQALFQPVVAHLKKLSPSAIDFELRSLTLGTPDDDDGAYLVGLVLDWVGVELAARSNFEMCQAILSRVLSLHADVIALRPELQARLAPLRTEQEAAWKGLRGLIQHSLCLLSFFSHQH